MADFNQNFGPTFNPDQSNQSQAPETNPPPNSVPSSPGLEVGIRTMQSDAESFKASGGVDATPDVIKIPGSSSDAPISFETGNGGATPPPIEPGSSSKKKILLVILIIVLALVLSLLGYFVVYPILFPATPIPPPAPVTQAPTPPQPAPEPVTPPIAESPKHESLLIVKADEIEEIDLPIIDLNNIRGAYLRASSLKLAPELVREVVLLGPGKIPLFVTNLFLTLMPDLGSDILSQNLNDNFSSVIYFDANGVWPVYIAKLKNNAVLSSAQTALSKIEESTKLNNLFVEDPGASISEFKNGTLNGKITRYKTYSKTGAAINYGWFGDYFVVGTSYNAFKEIVRRLGF